MTLEEVGLRAISNVHAERMPVADKIEEADICTYKKKRVHVKSIRQVKDDKKMESVPDELKHEC